MAHPEHHRRTLHSQLLRVKRNLHPQASARASWALSPSGLNSHGLVLQVFYRKLIHMDTSSKRGFEDQETKINRTKKAKQNTCILRKWQCTLLERISPLKSVLTVAAEENADRSTPEKADHSGLGNNLLCWWNSYYASKHSLGLKISWRMSKKSWIIQICL